jgi:RNA polymerase sigma-70 factor (ECF subfamily)
MNATDIFPEDPLCSRLAADLEGSFEEMVVLYQDRLYAFALRLTGSSRDAEEIAQDAFVRAYRALRGYSAERVRELALKAWLYRITLNVARNRSRGKKLAAVSLDQESDGAVFDLPDDGSVQPEVLSERADERERLARLVASLPERYRAAVVLRYVTELSYADAAEVLKQPVGTVKANVHRGILQLRAAMAGQKKSAIERVEVRQ